VLTAAKLPAGQVPDGQGDQEAGQGEQRQRPPPRGAAEAQRLGKVGEEPLLEAGDQGEEAVGGRRDRHPEDRRQHQQPDIASTSKDRGGIG
jgi:hypothetical protein